MTTVIGNGSDKKTKIHVYEFIKENIIMDVADPSEHIGTYMYAVHRKEELHN